MHTAASVMRGAVSAIDQSTIVDVLNSRLCKSSQSTINSVQKKWWGPFLLKNKLDFATIPAGSPDRGGIMASFALYMARGGLKYGTLQGYVWAVCEHHIQVGGILADPLDNVQDWARFMSALEVQAWVDSSVEPHEMVPFQLFVRTLRHLDVTSHADVLLGCILVFMYHTMSRSETPVPKTRTGQHNFDPKSHIRCRDVRVLQVSSTLQVEEWGFGSIKQDKRSKRARKDPDGREWKPVGEATGILSMMFWFTTYLSFVGDRDPETPFFVGPDGRHAVYSELLDSFREAMTRVPGVTMDIAKKYGLHGLRVLGYNCWRAAEGEDVAVLQGGWGSEAHRSYGRETLEKVLGAPQKAAAYAAMHSLPPMPLDALGLELCLPDPVAAPLTPQVPVQLSQKPVPARAPRVVPGGRCPQGAELDTTVHEDGPIFWRHHHCESSRCEFDLGHQGPHSHDLVTGKRRR